MSCLHTKTNQLCLVTRYVWEPQGQSILVIQQLHNHYHEEVLPALRGLLINPTCSQAASGQEPALNQSKQEYNDMSRASESPRLFLQCLTLLLQHSNQGPIPMFLLAVPTMFPFLCQHAAVTPCQLAGTETPFGSLMQRVTASRI